MADALSLPRRLALPHRADTVRTATATEDVTESRIRLVFGALMVLVSLVGRYGVSWDIQWHAMVGRDRFWTPPHIMLYSGSFFVGIFAIIATLVETARYYQGAAAANDTTLSPVLGFFRAPLGVALTGFGMLATAIAAPLDNYWHTLYGIDVSIWAPFHVMGILGGCIAALGVIYLFASEVTRAREREAREGRRFGIRLLGFRGTEVALTFAVANLLASLYQLIIPAVRGKEAYALFAVAHLSLYTVMAAAVVPLFLVATTRAIGKPGAALLIGFWITLTVRTVAWFVPWATAMLVRAEGFQYRQSAPSTILVTDALPQYLLLTALVVELVFLAARRWDHHAPYANRAALLIAGGAATVMDGVLERPWAHPYALRSLGGKNLLDIIGNLPAAEAQQRIAQATGMVAGAGGRGVSYANLLRTLASTQGQVNVLIHTLPLTLVIGLAAAWLGGGLGLVLHRLDK